MPIRSCRPLWGMQSCLRGALWAAFSRLEPLESGSAAWIGCPTFHAVTVLGAQRRNHRLQVFVCSPETPLELVGEIPLVVRGIVEFVFVFDVHGAGIAGFGEDGEEALPIHRALAGNPKTPPSRIVQRIDAGTTQDVPEDFAVFKVDVVD